MSCPVQNRDACALSFVDRNIIRLIDGPVKLLEIIKMMIEGHFSKQNNKATVKFTVKDGVPQFTIKSRVFDASTLEELVSTRTLLSQIISKMTASQFDIITSCQTRVTNAGMRPQELDTWIIQCPYDGVMEEKYSSTPDLFGDDHDGDQFTSFQD